MENLTKTFGKLVFNDDVMRARLPKDSYRALKKTIDEGLPLDETIANEVAHAMKEWAVENGATHYTHWFQPLTGYTAEKHDSFLNLQKDGTVALTFSGKRLIRGEPDASSFPSGGLRNTFEARGYTAWDPTSYAFIKDKTLCIPTVFCSYGGQILDKKTPLLRSCEAVSREASRVLRALGEDNCSRVLPKTGAEQEYFLLERSLFDSRPDLRLCGRTLFGAPAPRKNSQGAHYFGAIEPKIKAFMEDLDSELWALGVYASTEHNESAPKQYELAVNYSDTNVAVDQNQLIMETLKNVAERHSLVCLLGEKPFEGVNGSGKHNNWSLSTPDGRNLFEPGKNPGENLVFLVFMAAVITAVDEYGDLLRISVASAGNDVRLGGNEAPPSVLSIYLGEDMTALFDAVSENRRPTSASAEKATASILGMLPELEIDTSDRNRTSPFAFTGNKFEFRMAGASQSVSDCNMVLNTAVASVLSSFADKLESSKKPLAAAMRIFKASWEAHRRIVFNGNNYSSEWAREAAKRGLSSYKTAADAVPHLLDEKNVALFAKMGILTHDELRSRCEILLDNYRETVESEARTMNYIARKMIVPAISEYSSSLASGAAAKCAIGLSADHEKALAAELVRKITTIDSICASLDLALAKTASAQDCRDMLIPKMKELRSSCDEAELLIDEAHKPFPDYASILFGE